MSEAAPREWMFATDGTVYVSRRDAILRIDRNRFGDAASVSTLVISRTFLVCRESFDAIAFEKLADGPPAIFSRLTNSRMAGFYVSNPDTGSTSLFSEYSGSGKPWRSLAHCSASDRAGSFVCVLSKRGNPDLSDGRSVETFAEIQAVARRHSG